MTAQPIPARVTSHLAEVPATPLSGQAREQGPVVIRLPVPPPSVNNMFVNNRRTGGRFVSDHYKQWRNEAGWELLRQKPRSIRGPVSLDVRIQDGTGRDLSNMIKAVEDLLVTHEVIQGDGPKYVRRITMAFGRDVSGVVVTICGEAA